MPDGRREADKLREAQVARAASDRRKEPRYIPVRRRAYLGWWQGDTFETARAVIENLSRSGVAALVGKVPPDVEAVWVCFVDSPSRSWYPADVVGVSRTADGGQTIRIALPHPLPYCVFAAIVWGFRRPRADGDELTTKLVALTGSSRLPHDFVLARPRLRTQSVPGQVAHYQILECLGAGGMGQVYLAEDSELERRVAVKVMHPHLARDSANRQRFLREARAAAAIQHDNIVTIYQVGQHDELPFLAMQLLEGETLAARLERAGRLPLPEIVRIGSEIALGLHAAHQVGLIHRDIKPENIWLEEGRQRVKLLDFGLARTVAEDADLTQAGHILGTPAYMSPEQATNEPCDHRSDLFSLGIVLYRLCGGVLPFSGKSAFATMSAITKEAPRPLEELNPDLPSSLVALVAQLLSKKPEDRPRDGAEVNASLCAIGAALAN